jgi:hypothetical protein
MGASQGLGMRFFDCSAFDFTGNPGEMSNGERTTL